MPGPLQAAGAAPEPTEYAPLTMDRYITGLYTQRSLLRDADTSYLMAKFYSATRFDSLCDGLNREVSAKLTMIRRPGHTVYNANTFPPIRTYFSYKFMQNGVQQLRVMADTDASVFDATPPGKATVMTKSAGAGRTRFLSIGTELFMANGVDLTKWVQSSKAWQANTAFNAGDFIVDPAGNLQYIQSNAQTVANIATVQVVQAQKAFTGPFYYILIITFTQPTAPVWATGATINFAGLTSFPVLNGTTITYTPVSGTFNLHLTANQSAFFYNAPVYPTPPITGPQPDTGTVTGGSTNAGTSGATQPSWNETLGGTTQDGTIVWTCGGPQLQKWAIPGPTTAPQIINSGADRYWQANANLGLYYACYDANENIQVIVGNPGAGNVTGSSQPNWAKNLGGYTYDKAYQWVNCGNVGSWGAGAIYPAFSAILDSNGNLQIAWAVVAPGESGTSIPGWNTVLGGTTLDNNITWLCAGPGIGLAFGSVSYCYAWESIDGSVTTASPLATIPNGVLGSAGGYQVTLQGITPPDPQCTLIDIFRTAQGGATPVLLTKIPNPSPGVIGSWTFVDTLPDSALNPLQPAPLAFAGNPPPAGATAPAFHLQRVWMIVGSRVIWSGGPDTIFGNGNTAFPPANTIDFQEALTRLIPITTNQGAALLVIGTANTYAVLGQGTADSPFYPVSYMASVGCMQYDAVCMIGSTIYMFTNNSKFISLDPSAGYTESGFPIGDQFTQMTTGLYSTMNPGSVYNPTTTYVTWYEKKSGDSGIFVSDGALGWLRYSPIASPEQGFLWSPFAAIVGGTSAVLSVETATGQFNLLVGPPAAGGPILMRDTSVNTDNGVTYPAWMVMGNVVLCESGEVAEVAHIALDSILVGDRPTVGMLYSEIAPSEFIDFDTLEWTSVDPPNLDGSATLYSDRYSTLQDGECPKCTHCQIKVDWGEQDAPDELLSHTIYGAKFGERRQAA